MGRQILGSGMLQAVHGNSHFQKCTQISLATEGQIHAYMKIIQTHIYKSTVPSSKGICED
jgi:hypothetical protein